jgi:hypothetical protein
MLFDPVRHEPLTTTQWNASAAHAAIERIAAGSSRDYTSNGLWPMHPLDNPSPNGPDRTLYFGATGVMWGLEYLHRAGAAGAPPDCTDARAELLEANRRILRRFTPRTGSLWMGDAGILLTEWQRTRSGAVAAQLADVIAANGDNPTLEFMWGASGTMLAALQMYDWTGAESWADLFRAWQQCIANAIATIALRQDALANWTQSIGSPRPGRTDYLVQYCHGAPGVIICVASLPEPGLDELLVEAGELVWRAGRW